MAKGRTISAKELNPMDRFAIKTCADISTILKSSISDLSKQRDFHDKYGKMSYSRDAGAGRGAGKLQRDAICTRGTTSNLPISNRNLRWHPLVVAAEKHSQIKTIENILIDKKSRKIKFAIKDSSNNLKVYEPEHVHMLEERFAVVEEHWKEFEDELSKWEDDDWTHNSCLIPVAEACEWTDSVETFVSLGLSVLGEFFEADIDKAVEECSAYIEGLNRNIESQLELKFIEKLNEINTCPVCLEPLSSKLDQFRKNKRIDNWQPIWRQNKRNEGEDSSIQVMHVNPLNEIKFMHNAHNVRYGHRWCNVAMTDHSLEETLEFMTHVVNVHDKNE
jgi:hypothetical protein